METLPETKKLPAETGAREETGSGSDLIALPVGDLPGRSGWVLLRGIPAYLGTLGVVLALLARGGSSPWVALLGVSLLLLVPVAHSLRQGCPELEARYPWLLPWILSRSPALVGLLLSSAFLLWLITASAVFLLFHTLGSLAAPVRIPVAIFGFLVTFYFVGPFVLSTGAFAIPEVLLGRGVLEALVRARRLMTRNLAGNLGLLALHLAIVGGAHALAMALASLSPVLVILIPVTDLFLFHWSLVLWTVRWKQLALQRGSPGDLLLE